MLIKTIEIEGLRGFGAKQQLNFSEPNSELGSGLNILVGANNSGKSTIIEAINAFTNYLPPSFTEGKRNSLTGKKVKITIHNFASQNISLATIGTGGSETEFHSNGIGLGSIQPFIVPSRRNFSPFFGKGKFDRDQYISNHTIPATRGTPLDRFAQRLFKLQDDQKERKNFNREMAKIIENLPEWTIEQHDSGNYYLKMIFNNKTEHNSDGAGEGLLSIFIIIDALYDSKPGDLIIIDEPELSIHPSQQRKLLDLFLEYSRDRQILISTHSPYFISWHSIANNGQISRITREDTGSTIYSLDLSIKSHIATWLKNINNPHVFGLVANEVFFLSDKIILVEGQEDVLHYSSLMKQLEYLDIKGNFYGWGVGGADNMKNIASILKSLGYKKVIGVLDKNKEHLIPNLKKEFSDYDFIAISKDNVCDKDAMPAKVAMTGLVDKNSKMKDRMSYKEISSTLRKIKTFLNK